MGTYVIANHVSLGTRSDYLLLFIAQWTSQIVAVYSAGKPWEYSKCQDAKTQKLLTLLIGVLGIILGIAGFRQIHGLVVGISVVFAPLASIMSVDFFFLRKEEWKI